MRPRPTMIVISWTVRLVEQALYTACSFSMLSDSRCPQQDGQGDSYRILGAASRYGISSTSMLSYIAYPKLTYDPRVESRHG